MEYFESGYPKECNGNKFDSDIEYGFYKWCEEMHRERLIESFNASPQTYTLLDDFNINCVQHMKTKTKEESKCLLNGAVFTPDFEIVFTGYQYYDFLKDKNWTFQKKFIPVDIKLHSDFDIKKCRQREIIKILIDTKGSNNTRGAQAASSNLRFSYQRKLMFATLGIYCNKFIPDEVYMKTFVPEDWARSPKTAKIFPRYKKTNLIKDYLGEIRPF